MKLPPSAALYAAILVRPEMCENDFRKMMYNNLEVGSNCKKASRDPRPGHSKTPTKEGPTAIPEHF